MSSIQTLQPYSLTLLPSRHAREFQPLTAHLSESELDDLFLYIWAHDSYVYEHPRYRLQTALAIMLVFHLGLHLAVALSEGFHYRDVKVLVTKKDNTFRVLLLLCLEGRKKFQNTSTRWKGITMILTDNPSKRHMCPVTLFLSLAFADKFFDFSELSDFDSLEVGIWPAWTELTYLAGASDISIMRRTSSTSKNMTLHGIRASFLDKMMRAQLQRADKEATFVTINYDNKRAARRDQKQRRRSGINQPLLIGRGQGELIRTLLASHLVTSPWESQAFGQCTKKPQSPFPLPGVVKAQLRYDPVRASMISCFYKVSSLQTHLSDILWPFVEAAAPVPLESYFTDAEPNEKGNCPWCSKNLSRTRMKMHLLRCSQQNKIAIAEEQCVPLLPGNCLWEGCNTSFEESPLYNNAQLVATHISHHLALKSLTCLWNGCYQISRDIVELHIHLDEDHGVLSEGTLPTRAHFCYECGVWIMADLDWYMHEIFHRNRPSLVCGPVTINGILASPGRCPFCTAQGTFHQFNNPVSYVEHIDRHLVIAENAEESVSCPHPFCSPCDIEVGGLRKHMGLVHHVNLSSR